jgi:DNA-binding protein H-NS
MKVNVDANIVQRAHKVHRVKSAQKAQQANKAHKAHKAQPAQKAHHADKVQKVKINAQELFKTMHVSPAKTFGQTTGTTGNVFVTPPGLAKTDDDDKANGNKLAAKVNALRTPPGQAVKELNADKGSKLVKLGKADFTEQLAKKIEKLMNAYKNLGKFQTDDQESGIFKLSNRMETISSLFGTSKDTGSSRPLGNFVNSNLGITNAINQGGGVRID